VATEDEVRKASKQFYDGLTRMAKGTPGTMNDIWSHSASVTAMHPIMDRDIGRDAVLGSFDQVSNLATEGQVEIKNQLIRVMGDVAYEIGNEVGQFELGGQSVTINHRVTNIYQSEGGTWKMIHHHADSSPAMQEALNRLQSQPAKAMK
jgi:ketosteroid isomerase-like protein